ncbi:MAG TPA: SDR family oxidoreductase [Rhizomicrobium sp.]|nr:SDR family oxidoreductase [Rhizomicrobium sp.]
MAGICADKIALVLGGTRGLGRAMAEALVQAGATVVASGRNAASGTDAKGIHSAAIDVSDPPACRTAIDGIAARFGRLDILIANAGISPYWKRAETIEPAMWDEVMDVNLRGLFFGVQAAGRHMLAQGAGSIVVISSVTASVGVPRGLPYVASKGGLDAMTRSLAVEWAAKGVRVNAVAPGYFETDMTQGLRDNDGLSAMLLKTVPMGRFGELEEIGGIVTFLASDAASYVTGQVFTVDGGFSAGRDLV